MFRTATILSFGLLVIFAALPAAADEQPEPDVAIDEANSEAGDVEQPRRNFDQQHRVEIYEASRLNPWHAVAYTAAFPGLGNFYVEQYALGTVALSAMVFAGMFIGFGWTYGHSDLIGIGAAIAGSAYVGGAISSYFGARSYNDKLRRSLHVHDGYNAAVRDSATSATIGWTWRF